MNLSAITRAIATVAPETDAALTLAERPERLHGVWAPLERMLAEMECTGELDSVRGMPVFREHGHWCAVVPALRGVIEFHELAASRYGMPADTAALAKLANRLDAGVPLFQRDLDEARAAIARLKRQAAGLTVAQAIDLVQTVQIRWRVHGEAA